MPRRHPQALLAAAKRASWARSASASSTARAAGLEAQLANLADEIAYNNHDVDDGMRAGLITLEELARCRWCGATSTRSAARTRQLPGAAPVHETVRRMINEVVVDVIQKQRGALRAAAPAGHRRGARSRTAADRHERRRCARSTSNSSSSCASTCIVITACCA